MADYACGTVFKYGDNIDTDVIIPARYLNITDMNQLSAHCMEDLDRSFIRNVRKNDIIVGGLNFGCGSSREHAPAVIQACGIRVVIAKSFARIFYRNAINIGLAILECAEACDRIQNGDKIAVDFRTGRISDETTGAVFQAKPFPDFIRRIIDAGGIMKAGDSI